MDQLGTTFISSNYLALAIFTITATFAIAARYRVIVVKWLNGLRGHDWPQTSAVIDLVTVVPQTEQTRYGERVVGYLAALTYFYRNPELQMGEYNRMFNLESDAKTWADSYKGRNVMIHVDPRDPSRSILRKEDLKAICRSSPVPLVEFWSYGRQYGHFDPVPRNYLASLNRAIVFATASLPNFGFAVRKAVTFSR